MCLWLRAVPSVMKVRLHSICHCRRHRHRKFSCPSHMHQSNHCTHPLPLTSLHKMSIKLCELSDPRYDEHTHTTNNTCLHITSMSTNTYQTGLTVYRRLKVLQTNGALYSPHILISVSESNTVGHRRRDSKSGLQTYFI